MSRTELTNKLAGLEQARRNSDRDKRIDAMTADIARRVTITEQENTPMPTSPRMATRSAYEVIRDALTGAGHRVDEKTHGQLTAQCPAHDDGNPSLSVSIGKTGDRAVIYCFAGCVDTDVLAALDLTTKDLFDESTTYRYTGGAVVHRGPGKKFWQDKNSKLADRSLFRVEHLPADTTTPVLVVEGEKDANTAAYLDEVYAVSPRQGSATEPNRYDWSPLKGRPVVIVADNDDAGRKHARRVAELLANVAASVKVVQAAEGKDFTDHIQNGHGVADLVAVDLDETKPPEGLRDLDGADVLNLAEEFIGRYLHLPTKHALIVLTLWAAHTHASKSFYVTPRLVLDSPEPGSGKTRVLELLALLSHNAKLTLSTTTAALYRRIAAAEGDPPTILQDEADAIFGRTNNPQAEDLRALFNAGYKAGATVDRCEGDSKNMKVREFPVFAPVALAGLAGKMPATITTRAVTIHMRRRAPGEQVDEYRERDAAAIAVPIRDQLAAWITANREVLADARPSTPEGVRDRPAEVWEALLAVADLAGGEWPNKARAACRHFVLDSDPEELSFGARLLRDIKAAFGDREAMWTVDLINALTEPEESEWADLWGKPLDARRLARELKKYGIKSKNVRDGLNQAKGYEVAGQDGLAQAWRRYLPTEVGTGTDKQNPPIRVQGVASVPPQVNGGFDPSRDPSRIRPAESRDASRPASVPGSVPPETPSDQQECMAGTTGTDETHTDGGRQASRPRSADPFASRRREPDPECRVCGEPLKYDGDRAAGYCTANSKCVKGATA